MPAIDAGEGYAAGTTTCAVYAPVTSAAAATASQRRPITRSGGSGWATLQAQRHPKGPPRSLPRLTRWHLKNAGTDKGNIIGATGVGAVAFRRRAEFTLPSIYAVGKVQRDGSGG
jgi:hypothetical protein